MQVGRPDIVVVVVMLAIVGVPVMVVLVEEKPGTDEIYDKAEHRDGDRLVEADRDRRQQAIDRLISDEQGNERENDRAGEPSEFAELPCSE